jgi:neutral ceramidase
MKKRRVIYALFFLIGLCASIPGIGASCRVTELYAGTAKAEITPADTTVPIHDPLFLRTLVLDVDGNRIAFIAADLGSYFNRELLDIAKKRFGIEQVLTSGSHTHSSYCDRSPDSPNGKRLLKIAIAGLAEAMSIPAVGSGG